MKGYECVCGKRFVYPKLINENNGFAENPHWESYYVCPYCYSSEFEEIELPETDENREIAYAEAETRYAEEMYNYYCSNRYC